MIKINISTIKNIIILQLVRQEFKKKKSPRKISVIKQCKTENVEVFKCSILIKYF